MNKTITLAILFALGLFGCKEQTKESNTNETATAEVLPSEWVQNATIYEVNLRMYSRSGNIEGFKAHLPRLKELGVDVLWFMPIHPIGKLNRKAKGDLFVQDLDTPDYNTYPGSPYAVQDYKAVNPEYGSVDDFKKLVDACHEMGFKVVLDWVANHTAWDNKWVTDHPDWYTKDSTTGKITQPIGTDWTDVADLNYENEEMRAAMIDALKFWVEECNIDGYRCDVAMNVPTDFWEAAREEMEKIKPVFMLAESEGHVMSHYDKAFDAYYGWEMHHVLNQLASGKENPNHFIEVSHRKDSAFAGKAFPMNFITNHDENSWNGTIEERMGDRWKQMAVISYAIQGMPLIYSGQEVGLNHRLKFFEHDSISWKNAKAKDYTDFYTFLNTLKADSALRIDAPQHLSYESGLLKITRGKYQFAFNFTDNELPVEYQLIDGQKAVLSEGYKEGMIAPKGFAITVLEGDC